jgi:hypothetical protein
VKYPPGFQVAIRARLVVFQYGSFAVSLAKLFALREKAAKLAAEAEAVSAEAQILEKEIIISLNGKNTLSVGGYTGVILEKFSLEGLELDLSQVPERFRTSPRPFGSLNMNGLRALFPTSPETVRKFAQVSTWKTLQVTKK